jgi:hypothetical protein
METPPSYATTLATVAAGRAAAVAELRQLADRLEQLPVDAAAEALVRLGARYAAARGGLALERVPAGST